MRVLKLTNNAEVRTLYQVQDTTAKVLVKGPNIPQTAPRECAKKYKAQHIHLSEVWLDKIQVCRGDRQHEHITQQYRAHQESTRTTTLDFIQLCEVVPQVINKTAGIDCIVPEHVKRMGVRGLRRVLNIVNQPMHTWLGESKTALHMAFEKGAEMISTNTQG